MLIFQPLHVSVPLDHLQGAHIRTLLKLLKLHFLLKYQLKHFVKIVLAWRMNGSACGVCSGCCVACDCVTRHTASTAHTLSRNVRAPRHKNFNEVF
jgi:hypothetical protein